MIGIDEVFDARIALRSVTISSSRRNNSTFAHSSSTIASTTNSLSARADRAVTTSTCCITASTDWILALAAARSSDRSSRSTADRTASSLDSLTSDRWGKRGLQSGGMGA